MRALHCIIRAEGLDMKLNIGGFKVRVGFQKPSSQTGSHGHGAGAFERIFNAHHGLSRPAFDFRVDGAEVCFENWAGLKMILKVLSHTRKIAFHRYSPTCQFLSRTDTRNHQNMW